MLALNFSHSELTYKIVFYYYKLFLSFSFSFSLSVSLFLILAAILEKPEKYANMIKTVFKKEVNDGAMTAMRYMASHFSSCEIASKDELKRKHQLRSQKTTNATVGGWWSDDDSGSSSCTCSIDSAYSCIESCSDTVESCATVLDTWDILDLPSCVEDAASCFQNLGGSCCQCVAYYDIIDCSDC